MFVCMYYCMFVLLYVCMYVLLYVCTTVCMYYCMFVCMYYCMFLLQFVMGFVFYLFPGMSEANKIWYMGSHRFWGVAIFCMALATALLGITENTLFKVR